jgi:F-type H+-transporting ATPase subunit delta
VAAASVARDRDCVGRVGDDLKSVAQIIGERGPAYDFFVAPVVERQLKQAVLTKAFEGRIDDVALNVVLLLVRKRREALLGAIVEEYLALERASRGAERLTLTTAHTLDRCEYDQLIERLERLYGKKFEVVQRVDPALIGGLRLQMGDRRIDATVSGRLDALARDLSTAPSS